MSKVQSWVPLEYRSLRVSETHKGHEPEFPPRDARLPSPVLASPNPPPPEASFRHPTLESGGDEPAAAHRAGAARKANQELRCPLRVDSRFRCPTPRLRGRVARREVCRRSTSSFQVRHRLSRDLRPPGPPPFEGRAPATVDGHPPRSLPGPRRRDFVASALLGRSVLLAVSITLEPKTGEVGSVGRGEQTQREGLASETEQETGGFSLKSRCPRSLRGPRGLQWSR